MRNRTRPNPTLARMAYPYTDNFPASQVVDNMLGVGVPTTLEEVKDLWTFYWDATVNQGIPEFQPTVADGKTRINNSAIVNALASASGFDKNKVVAFLNATASAFAGVNLAEHPSVAEVVKDTASDVGTTAANLVAPVAESTAGLLKWVAIGVVGAAVIYGLYNYKKMKRGA